jgi:peptidoglycan/LPS O-acetylase OafA/YrhL
MTAGKQSGERIAYIDGLRAVAVLLVVAHHAMLHSPLLPRPIPFLSWAHLMLEGAHGVDLFFVLSGFCLSYPLLYRLRREGTAAFDLARYFAKRVVRIVPPYYAAIALLLAVPGAGVGVADLLKQLLFLDWHTNLLNGSFWTLCVEFRWYFVFPLALALWIRSPRVFCTVALLTVLAYEFTRLRAPDIGTLPAFLLGIAAADIEVRKLRLDAIVWLCAPVCVLLALVLEQSASMPAPYGGESAIFFVQTNAGWQLAAFFLVLAGTQNAALRRALSFKPLVAIGTASYSIYLLHEPAITIIQQRLGVPPGLRMALAYGLAVVTGMAFWALFERVWMFGRVKDLAVAALQPRIRAVARALEVPDRLHFPREPHTATEFGIE